MKNESVPLKQVVNGIPASLRPHNRTGLTVDAGFQTPVPVAVVPTVFCVTAVMSKIKGVAIIARISRRPKPSSSNNHYNYDLFGE